MSTKHDSAARRSVLDRRGFLAGSAALGVTLIEPRLVRGAEANSKIALGLIGCGGRGAWIADLFQKHGGYQFVAAADYFQDRVDAVGNKLGIEAARRYTGLSGYKKLLEGKLDAVVIETPPYFHPEQAMAAVDAGRHVFVAKPIAVDVPGCLTIGAAGAKAGEKKLCFLADFQTRANPLYQEAVRRVHAGEIGPLVNGEAVYYCGPTWTGDLLKNDPNNPELRLRVWGIDRILSGDIITEQNIHALDVATWIVDRAPVRAYGTGGRKARTEPGGNCWDHFAVVYYFPNDVVINFTSKQYGAGYDDIGCRVFGSQGTVDTHYFGAVSIAGQKPFAGGSVGNLFTDGAVANIATFHESITKGQFANPTVAPSVRSNLTTILGRTAAYKRAEVTWDEMLKANEKLEFKLEGLKG